MSAFAFRSIAAGERNAPEAKGGRRLSRSIRFSATDIDFTSAV